MRHLQNISIALTLLGATLVVAAQTADLGATWTVAGLLLVVAGLVKVAMIALWRGVAGFGSPSIGGDDV